MTLARKRRAAGTRAPLRLVPCAEATVLEGTATRVRRDGRIDVRVAGRPPISARLPLHVSGAWIRAALAVAPLPVAVALFPSGMAVLWCVVPADAHAHLVSDRATTATETFRVDAPQGVELRCGDASLTFEPDGKVRLRGREILSRATGIHRIKGGAVRIN